MLKKPRRAIACLVRTREIYDDFAGKYGNSRGIISKKKKNPRLLLVTTSSALGRSSIYNRLSLDGVKYFWSIGFTGGWGHFHISDDLFLALRDFLKAENHPYVKRNRFGQGPNWRLRTIREALRALGLPEQTLHHGLRREVFFCPLAGNALEILKNGDAEPDAGKLLSISDVAAAAPDRWIVKRAASRLDYRSWRKSTTVMAMRAAIG